MLVHKGGKIKNWGGECRNVTPTKLQSHLQNCSLKIYLKRTVCVGGGGGGSGWGGQDGCEQRIKVFVKIRKKNIIFFFGGGGGGGGGGRVRGGGRVWGVRVDVNREVKFL